MITTITITTITIITTIVVAIVVVAVVAMVVLITIMGYQVFLDNVTTCAQSRVVCPSVTVKDTR